MIEEKNDIIIINTENNLNEMITMLTEDYYWFFGNISDVTIYKAYLIL